MLYPAELQAQNGAGDGNRTHTTSLEGWDSAIELHPHTYDGDYCSKSPPFCQEIPVKNSMQYCILFGSL